MFNQRGFVAPIIILVVIGLITIAAVGKIGGNDKVLPKIPNNRIDDQRSAIQPNPTVDPQVLTDTVKKFYSHLSSREFDQAWRLLSKNAQDQSEGYDFFIKGFAITKKVSVQDIQLQDLSTKKVFIKLQSTDNINNQTLTKNFQGTWELKLEDGAWKLDNANISLVSTSPRLRQEVINQPQEYYDSSVSDLSNNMDSPNNPSPTPKSAEFGEASMYQKVGNILYGSDGSNYMQVGDTTMGNNGANYNSVGDYTYGSDGTSYIKSGDTTFGNNGTVCFDRGTWVQCIGGN